MIERFLRSFAAFREMEEYAELCHRKEMKAADELDSQLSVNRAVREANIALQGELKAVKIIADGFAQRATGRKLFTEMPALPEEPAERKPFSVGKVQMSTLVQKSRARFAQEWTEKVNRAEVAPVETSEV